MSSHPKLVIDARMLGSGGHGFATYVTQLLIGLKARASLLPYQIKLLVAQGSEKLEVFSSFELLSCESRFLSPKEWFELPLRLAQAKADLFHSPTFMSLPCVSVPMINTVHDLNHLQYGSAAQRWYYRAVMRPALKRAPAVVTVSDFSKDELEKWMGWELTSPLFVAENAIDSGFLEAKKLSSPTGKPYFLCVTNSKPHKRWNSLLSAYQRYRAETPDPLPLVTTVPTSAPGVISIGACSLETLFSWVGNATAVFFPSEYEGFGLPPLESSIAGVPVVVSDIPVHREALRHFKNRQWVRVDDAAGWTRAFQGPFSSPPSLEERRAAAQYFSADRLAAQMDRIYRNVLGLSS